MFSTLPSITFVSSDIRMIHKTAKIRKRWYYFSGSWLFGDVLLLIINFLPRDAL